MHTPLEINEFPFKQETTGLTISLNLPDPSDSEMDIKIYVLRDNIEILGNKFIRVWEYSQRQYFKYAENFLGQDKNIDKDFPYAIGYIRPWILPITSVLYIEELDFQPVWLKTKWSAMKECMLYVKNKREAYIKENMGLWTQIKKAWKERKS